MVEELLELFIDKVDGNLLKAIVLENLKASNVKHSTEVGLLQASINEGFITLLNQPLEQAVKDSSCNSSNSIGSLLTGLTLGDPFSTNLDPGLAEGLDHGSRISREGVRSNTLAFSLVISTLGLEFYAAKGHDSSSQHVAIKLLLLSKSKHLEGILSVFKLFIVINGFNLGFSLRHIDIIIDVIADMAQGLQTSSNIVSIRLEKLIEDVVGPLHQLLLSDTGLFQQVGHNVTTSQLARG